MKNIVIIGAGGVGRETSLIIQKINELEPTWNLIGFIDDNVNNWGRVVNGYSVIGGIDSLEVLPSDTYIIIAISNYEIKRKIVNKINNYKQIKTVDYEFLENV